MSNAPALTLYVPMLLAGLAGSLHCLAMCGPLLVTFSQAFRAPTSSGVHTSRSLMRRPVWLDLAGYHAGRIWTYGLLGWFAGSASQVLRGTALHFELRRPLALMAAAVLTGVAVWLLIGKRGQSLLSTDCGLARFRGVAWFQSLLRHPSMAARFLLGSLLGLIPCGLVYAMLVAAATMPTPLHSAVAMLVFGIGTIPALSTALVAGQWFGPAVRRLGPHVVALTFLMAAGLVVFRSLGGAHP